MRPLAKILRLDLTRPSEGDEKARLLKRPDFAVTNPVYLTVGKNAFVNQGVMMVTPPKPGAQAAIEIGAHTSVGRNNELVVGEGHRLVIGDYATTNRNCVLIGNVDIGRYSVLAYNIYISSGSHTISKKPTWLIRDQDHISVEDDLPVKIGEDVWLGYGVFVKQGVQIGRGAVIGANAVVTKDVPPYTIWAGVPAKQIGTRAPFAPPPKVCATDEACLPYFYSGFCPRQDDLRETAQTKCLRMLKEGLVVLSAGDAKKVRVRGKWLGSAPGELSVGNPTAEMARFTGAKEVDQTFSWKAEPAPRGSERLLSAYHVISFRASAPEFGLESVELI